MRQINHISQFKKNTLSALICIALVSPAAQADVYTWTGEQSSDFGDISENWRVTSDPSDDLVVINTPANGLNPIFDINNQGMPLYGEIQIGNVAGESGALSINKSNNPDVSYANQNYPIKVGLNGGSGELNIYDLSYAGVKPNGIFQYQVFGISSFNDGGALNIGQGTDSTGTVNLLGTGKTLVRQSNGGATADFNGITNVGLDGGKGQLNVDGAALSTGMSGALNIGNGANSVGEVNLLGGGKIVSGYIGGMPDTYNNIGLNGGTGVFNIAGQSDAGYKSFANIANGLRIGIGEGSQGYVNISDGGILQTYGSSTSDGYANIVPIQVGIDGGYGAVVIDGADSKWQVAGQIQVQNSSSAAQSYEIGHLYVGESGVGDVTLSNGGELSIGEVFRIYGQDEETFSSYEYSEFKDGTGTLHLGSTVDGNGTLNIGAALGNLAQDVGYLKAATVDFGSGAGTIVFNHTDQTGTYAFDTLLNGGNAQSQLLHIAGNTSFNVDQNAYTGHVNVTGGALSINGEMLNVDLLNVTGGIFSVNGHFGASQSNISGGVADISGRLEGGVQVSGAGVISGTGSVGFSTISAGGTVAPGANLGKDFGTLSFDSIEFSSGSIYQPKVDPMGQSDLIRVDTNNGGTGVATINGGQVQVIASNGDWKDNTKYVILDAEGGITGQFDGVTSNLAFLSPSLETDDNKVYLYLTRNGNSFSSIGRTPNQKDAGWGVDSLGPGNPIYDEVLGMDVSNALNTYDNLSGEIHASLRSSLLSNGRYVRSAVLKDQEPSQNLWVSSWGHTGDFKRNSNVERLDTHGYGFLVGADAYTNGVTTIGAAVGYERNSMSQGGVRQSRADVDAAHILLYGRTRVGDIDIRGGIDYSWLDIDTNRKIFMLSQNAENKASYNADMVQIFAEGSKSFQLNPALEISPYAGFVYHYMKTDAFTETGSFTALHGTRNSNHILFANVGLRGSWHANDKSMIYADLGIQQNLSKTIPTVNMNFIDGASFKIEGNTMNRTNAVVGVGAQFELSENMSLRIGYEGLFGNQSQDHAAKLLWNLRF